MCMLFSACSANWHIRQAVKKDPSILDTTRTVQVDTVRIDVPVVRIEELIKRDTLVEFRDGETVIRYKYNTLTDSIFVEADCPDQKVITKTEKITATVTVLPRWFWWVVGGAVAFSVLMFTIKSKSL